jgi:hypothetical protein
VTPAATPAPPPVILGPVVPTPAAQPAIAPLDDVQLAMDDTARGESYVHDDDDDDRDHERREHGRDHDEEEHDDDD